MSDSEQETVIMANSTANVDIPSGSPAIVMLSRPGESAYQCNFDLAHPNLRTRKMANYGNDPRRLHFR
jgi:hypothetical protein